ncbi:MAG: rod shape-determining protein RodA [Acidobacteria bacterium]|jgi:rod shape determining protein RodA|nr:rod shape-determining protein RodA [Acidobacteriota bacterium]
MFKDSIRFFDKFTFVALLLLTISGIILIYSVSHTLNTSYFSRQLVFFFVVLIVFFIVFRFKTEVLFDYSVPIYVLLLVILGLQLLLGVIVAGTKSWIKMGFFSIQVSEFIKIPLALILAKTITKVKLIEWNFFFKLLGIIGIPFVLIAIQPDLGTAFMLGSFLISIVILKKIRLVIVLFTILAVFSGAFIGWNYLLKPYQKDRVISFLNPEKYKKSSGYQIIQSKIAVGSGGLSGKGYLNGTQSQYKFLPTRHTDFIVAVLGEEFGFLGISFLFVLFFILFYRQYNIKTNSDEEFYYIYLFNGLILFQFLINILMSIGYCPIMGVPLPFVSYGGSSLLSFFIGEAIIFRIKINSYLND